MKKLKIVFDGAGCMKTSGVFDAETGERYCVAGMEIDVTGHHNIFRLYDWNLSPENRESRRLNNPDALTLDPNEKYEVVSAVVTPVEGCNPEGEPGYEHLKLLVGPNPTKTRLVNVATGQEVYGLCGANIGLPTGPAIFTLDMAMMAAEFDLAWALGEKSENVGQNVEVRLIDSRDEYAPARAFRVIGDDRDKLYEGEEAAEVIRLRELIQNSENRIALIQRKAQERMFQALVAEARAEVEIKA